MEALLTAIALWLSIHYGLPSAGELPGVEYKQRLEITLLRYRGATRDVRQRVVETFDDDSADKPRSVVSVYDPSRQVIVLRQGWTPETPRDLSVLVHEMVHHLQRVAGTKFSCAEEGEALAYEAQEAWLRLFGTSLEEEFDIDPLTILVTTRCMY